MLQADQKAIRQAEGKVEAAAHKEALEEAKRRERDAAADVQVQALTAEWEQLTEAWYLPACKVDHWTKRAVQRWWDEPTACTTPGRTVSSIRRLLVKLYVKAVRERGYRFDRGLPIVPLPQDAKVREGVVKALQAMAEGSNKDWDHTPCEAQNYLGRLAG